MCDVSYILRFFRLLQPLNGTDVLSKMLKILRPALLKPFKDEYLPFPKPLTMM